MHNANKQIQVQIISQVQVSMTTYNERYMHITQLFINDKSQQQFANYVFEFSIPQLIDIRFEHFHNPFFKFKIQL